MQSGRTVRIIFFGILLFLSAGAISSFPEEPLLPGEFLQQVSDHCYFLHIEESGENIALVVTEQGTLLFDPPPEPDLSILIEFLERAVGKPVRWMVRTGYSPFFTAGVEYFAQQGVVLLPDSVNRNPPLLSLQTRSRNLIRISPANSIIPSLLF